MQIKLSVFEMGKEAISSSPQADLLVRPESFSIITLII